MEFATRLKEAVMFHVSGSDESTRLLFQTVLFLCAQPVAKLASPVEGASLIPVCQDLLKVVEMHPAFYAYRSQVEPVARALQKPVSPGRNGDVASIEGSKLTLWSRTIEPDDAAAVAAGVPIAALATISFLCSPLFLW